MKIKGNPKRVSVGDIMRFYYRDGSDWLDDNDVNIPGGTNCVVVEFTWNDTSEYVGYFIDLMLPNGTITRGWGEYAVEPVWMKLGKPKNWY